MALISRDNYDIMSGHKAKIIYISIIYWHYWTKKV